MKIEITMHGKVYTAQNEMGFDAEPVDEAVEMFKGLLVAAGYHPSNVDEYFNVNGEWFPETDADPEGSTRSFMRFPSDFSNKHDNEKCESITGQRDC